MASKRRRTASRDHRAVSLKSARTRALMAAARHVKPEPKPTEYALREMRRARSMMDKVKAAWGNFAAGPGGDPSAVVAP